MLRRPPRSTRTDTLVPTRRASGRSAGPGDRRQAQLLQTAGGGLGDGHARRYRCGTFWEALQLTSERGHILRARYHHYPVTRSEEHTSALQSLMRIAYAVFCLKKKREHDSNTLEE